MLIVMHYCHHGALFLSIAQDTVREQYRTKYHSAIPFLALIMPQASHIRGFLTEMRTLATRHYGAPFIPKLDNGHFKFDVSFRNHEFISNFILIKINSFKVTGGK